MRRSARIISKNETNARSSGQIRKIASKKEKEKSGTKSEKKIIRSMDANFRFQPKERSEWREWLTANHNIQSGVWLVRETTQPSISYIDAVEEALCFGWIDSVVRKTSESVLEQRFTPRRPRSFWSGQNLERARRLSFLGLMTDAGRQCLPSSIFNAYVIPDHVIASLQSVPGAWDNFCAFPPVYQRIRVRYIVEPPIAKEEREKRLRILVEKSALNCMYGNWTDKGRLLENFEEGATT